MAGCSVNNSVLCPGRRSSFLLAPRLLSKQGAVDARGGGGRILQRALTLQITREIRNGSPRCVAALSATKHFKSIVLNVK